MTLTPAQRDAFFRDGFTIVEQLFNRAEIALMAAAFDRAHAVGEAAAATLSPGQSSAICQGARVSYETISDQRPGVIRHISMVGNLEADLLRLGGDPRLLELALPLLGTTSARQMINQAHFKRPGTGVAFAWHQDIRHRGIANGRFVDFNEPGPGQHPRRGGTPQSRLQRSHALQREFGRCIPSEVAPCGGDFVLSGLLHA